MNTYRITENDIAGLECLAVGYKVFKNDWTTKHGNYDYKDENGNVLGTIHKVDGNLKECCWGLHFSKESHKCFNFYESVQWNKFAKVEAYGECVDSEDGDKSVATILKIVEIYNFDDFINLIQKNLQNNHIWGGNDISGGDHISGGNHIWGSRNCEGVSRCIFCYDFTGKLHLFNKPITESRFEAVYNKLCSFCWYPKFNNAYDLKGNLEWYETNIPAIVSVDAKTAWSFMPKEMLEYIESLPEYDGKIFKKITE